MLLSLLLKKGGGDTKTAELIVLELIHKFLQKNEANKHTEKISLRKR